MLFLIEYRSVMLVDFHLLSYPDISEINHPGFGLFLFQSFTRLFITLFWYFIFKFMSDIGHSNFFLSLSGFRIEAIIISSNFLVSFRIPSLGWGRPLKTFNFFSYSLNSSFFLFIIEVLKLRSSSLFCLILYYYLVLSYGEFSECWVYTWKYTQIPNKI